MFKNLFKRRKRPKFVIRDAQSQKRYEYYSFDDMLEGFEELTGNMLEIALQRNLLENYSVVLGHDRWWIDVEGEYHATDKEIREKFLGDGYWDQDYVN